MLIFIFHTNNSVNSNKLSFQYYRERVRKALIDVFNLTDIKKTEMTELNLLQFVQSKKEKVVPKMNIRTVESRDVFMVDGDGKEMAKRWCIENEKIVCKQLVRVDNTLLWADCIEEEEMMAAEENQDLFVFPANSRQDILSQAVQCTLEL